MDGRSGEQLVGQVRRIGLGARPGTGRYYLHSFFPEQPDLNWRNPDVRAEMQAALREEYGRLSHVNSANARDIGVALRAIREAVGDALVIGEAYLPTAQLQPYTEILDVVFAFEAITRGPTRTG